MLFLLVLFEDENLSKRSCTNSDNPRDLYVITSSTNRELKSLVRDALAVALRVVTMTVVKFLTLGSDQTKKKDYKKDLINTCEECFCLSS